MLNREIMMQPRALALTPTVKREIVKIIDDRIKDAHVTKEDFTELKAIVRSLGFTVGELAQAQKRTELKVEELAEAQKRTELKVEELAEAQKRTELKVEELAEAQKRTEKKVEELAEAQKRTEKKVEELAEAQRQTTLEVRALALGLKENREHLGGLSQSLGYAFENEAFRFLPKFLEQKHGLTITERMIRTEVGGKEINLFCRGLKNGREVLIVGESKLRLDERRAKQEALDGLQERIAAVKAEYGNVEIVPVLVTHFATKGFLALAQEQGVLVVQSFEW
jgi:myosin heavy subunit